MKSKLIAPLLGLLVGLLVPAAGAAAPPDDLGRPDRLVRAADVEIVKKQTLPAAPFLAQTARAPKTAKSRTAATGILGDHSSGNKYAIVVGVSDYPGTANDLAYGHIDAGEMAQALKTVYGYTDVNVSLFRDSEAKRSDILAAINRAVAKARTGDEIVFFFSGHGAKGRADDGDKEAMDESIVVWDGSGLGYIWDGELKAAFNGCAASRMVFIFDSCLSGGMTDVKGPRRVISMASTETGYSYEGPAWNNGEFTHYYVDLGRLGSDAAADIYDHDGDGVLGEAADVAEEEAWDYAKSHCTVDTPTISDSFVNDLRL